VFMAHVKAVWGGKSVVVVVVKISEEFLEVP
jgi:hypothetical protein